MENLNESVSKISLDNKEKIDSVLSFVFLKKLIKPITQTDAFKLGLVNNEGKIIKESETEKEKRALSAFDKVVFKIKNLLGSRVANLNAFIYLKTLEDDFYDNMIITGNLSKRAAISRMNKDIENIIESKYNMSLEDCLNLIIAEECKNKKYENGD